MTLQELEKALDVAQRHIDRQQFFSSLPLSQGTIDLLRDLLPSTTGEAGQALNARLEPPKSGVRPTVGRIVHIHYGDACRPAIVTGVRSEPNDEDIHYVDATEFRPHSGPQQLHGVPECPVANGWHWPQECPDGR